MVNAGTRLQRADQASDAPQVGVADMNRHVARGLRPVREGLAKHESSLASAGEKVAGRVISREGV